MGKYTGPKIRIIRRLGLLPGLTTKQPKVRYKTPGEHGKIPFTKTKRSSLKDDYKERLLEKQKLRFNYGITEAQLIRYCQLAKKKCRGSAGSCLLELLEARLDCIVHRLGFTSSIPSARQAINHGHICVNFRRVNIPSFNCKKGDSISVAAKQTSTKFIKTRMLLKLEEHELLDRHIKNLSAKFVSVQTQLPKHLEINTECIGRVLSKVQRKEVLVQVNDLKVIEYYS